MFVMCNMSCRQRIHRTCENILCGHVSKRIVRREGEKESGARRRVLYFQGGVCFDLSLFESFFLKVTSIYTFAHVQQLTTE